MSSLLAPQLVWIRIGIGSPDPHPYDPDPNETVLSVSAHACCTRYIAPDSERPVPLPTELKAEIVELICHESGLVSAHCFDQVP